MYNNLWTFKKPKSQSIQKKTQIGKTQTSSSFSELKYLSTLQKSYYTYYIFILDFNHSNIKNENAKEKWQLLIEPWFLPGVCFWNARRIEDLGSSRGGQAKFLTHEVGKVMIELYICPLHLSKLKGKTLKSQLKKKLHKMAHFHNTGKILVSHSKSGILGLYQAFFGQINPR